MDTEKEGTVSRFGSGAPGRRRAYSPSRPAADSSEDEGHAQENNVEPSGQGPVPSLAGRKKFTPKLDVNTFRLTSLDIEMLELRSHSAGYSDTALLIMTPGQSFSFVGTACIIILQGVVAILGTPVAPSLHIHHVFSPRSSPLVSLEASDVRSSNGDNLIHSSVDQESSTRQLFPQRVQNAAGALDSIVVIQRMQVGVEGLGRVCRTFHGVFHVEPDLKEAGSNIIGVDGFHLVDPHCQPHPQLQPFFLPESWKNALEAAISPLLDENPIAFSDTSFIALVRGPKKSGKSMFARTLLNHLTTRYRHVAFLECDLGQSEFTPGGMVSLHVVSSPVFGPPFTHPRLPYRAHYIGHTTPHNSPSHYLSCIQALMQTYSMDIKYSYLETPTNEAPAYNGGIENDKRIEGLVPLVVNTQGWVKGLGGDLLRKIEESVGATHVFDIDRQTSLLPQQRMRSSAASIHGLQPISTSPLAAYYTPADHRSLALLSYFHCVFPPSNASLEAVHWITDLPLCARPPWSVDYTEAFDQIILVGAGYEDVVPEEFCYAINCGVVALVCEDGAQASLDDGENNTDSLFPYKQGALPPDPITSYCVGLGLIRGIDAATHSIHMLTPVPLREFSRCRVLIKGELELPVWGMLDFKEQDGVAGIPWGKVPYLQMGGRGGMVGATGAGAGRRRVRRNLMRKAQM